MKYDILVELTPPATALLGIIFIHPYVTKPSRIKISLNEGNHFNFKISIP